MKRRDFHKAALTGIASTFVPASALSHLLPASVKCGHELRPGIACGQEPGHPWEHRMYKSVEPKTEYGELCSIEIHEWNDQRQIFPHDRREKGSAIYLDLSEGATALYPGTRAVDDIPRMVMFLKMDARKTLGPGKIYELRAKTLWEDGVREHEDYGCGREVTREQYLAEWGIAWYWRPAPHEIPAGFHPRYAMKQDELFELHPLNGIVLRSGGYRLFGRLRT